MGFEDTIKDDRATYQNLDIRVTGKLLQDSRLRSPRTDNVDESNIVFTEHAANDGCQLQMPDKNYNIEESVLAKGVTKLHFSPCTLTDNLIMRSLGEPSIDQPLDLQRLARTCGYWRHT